MQSYHMVGQLESGAKLRGSFPGDHTAAQEIHADLIEKGSLMCYVGIRSWESVGTRMTWTGFIIMLLFTTALPPGAVLMALADMPLTSMFMLFIELFQPEVGDDLPAKEPSMLEARASSTTLSMPFPKLLSLSST